MLRVFRLQFADDMGGTKSFAIFGERNFDGSKTSVAGRNDFQISGSPTESLLGKFGEVP